MQTDIGSLDTICETYPDRGPCPSPKVRILKFKINSAVVTVRVASDDEQSGADLIITNMTTLPVTDTGKRYGSGVIQILLHWARKMNLHNIQAVQVSKQSETFWIRNGFKKLGNETNDFQWLNSCSTP